MTHKLQSGVLKWSLIIGIIIVLNLFFNYSISLVYDAPDWNEFCPEEQVVRSPETEEMCLAEGGQWVETPKPVVRPGVDPSTTPVVEGYCNTTYECAQNYEAARESYDRTIFVILVVLGVLSLLAGTYTAHISQVVGTGLSYGGVLSLVIASMRYWSSAEDIIRVLILAAALIALIALGVKKFRDD